MLIGVDEAGRGPLVGSVVAAAVMLPGQISLESPGILSKVRDSKKMTEAAREESEMLIKNVALAYAVGCASAQEIDELNILNATFLAMRRAIESLMSSLDIRPSFEELALNVDGNRLSTWMKQAGFLRVDAVVKGDSKVLSISAASVLAKVERDRQMRLLDKQYPMYGFLKHKGYGTEQHIAAIKEHGPCPEHRMTFAPLKPPKA